MRANLRTLAVVILTGTCAMVSIPACGSTDSVETASIDSGAGDGASAMTQDARVDTCAADGASRDSGVDAAAAPTCSDSIKNGDETDVDCGGKSCSPCAEGL